MPKQLKDTALYDPVFVSGMFDRMSKTYGVANLISSFGFTAIWRKECLKALPPPSNPEKGYDLMSGMGEAWINIQKKLGPSVEIIAVDISEAMNKKAEEHKKRLKHKNISICREDILKNTLPDASADFVVSTFGIKTFNQEQLNILTGEISRILKPGGTFSFVEISEPGFLPLKLLYMFYLKLIIPLIGFLFLGNSMDYRMLGVYCAKFKNSQLFMQLLQKRGLHVSYQSYFFGCATGVHGRK
jgi:demethylmenaquinone methyltransferase/2-methoxy-6-polyprenyl-1,4-benzoquinol methylase